MSHKFFRADDITDAALGVVLLVVLTGCFVETPRREVAVMRVAPAPVQRVVVVEDDYVYYPGYEVYYSSNRRQYVYRDGNAWVTRPGPPHISLDVLLASPSVRMDFHDAPASHHEGIVRSYPRNWAPAGEVHAVKRDLQEERKGDDKRGKKDDRKDDRKDERKDDRKDDR